MAEQRKKGFIVYCDLLKHIEPLSMEQRGTLFTAILCDQAGGELPEMDSASKVAFSFVKSGIERDTEKYNKLCERRREAGKKGGDAKASNSKDVANCSKSKQNVANDSKSMASESTYLANEGDNGERISDNGKRTEEINKGMEVYQPVADMYNDTCVSFPRLTVLSDSRKKAIKARLKSYTLDDFKRLFEKAEASSFLKGANNRNWSANFDWLIQDRNMAKVLDGNYDDRGSYNPAAGTVNQAARELDDFYNMVTDWVESKEEQNG